MKTIKILLLGLAFLTATVGNSSAQDAKSFATSIFGFTKSVEWPASSQTGDFVISVVGNSPVYIELVRLSVGKTINNQKILVRKFMFANQIERCHILFVPTALSDKMDVIIEKVKPFNTLIICEQSGMVQKGSGISFMNDGMKLKFEMNIENIISKGLKLNNDINSLAANVQ